MSAAQLDELVALAVSLRPYVVRMLRDRAKLTRADADDLAQDTMLAVVLALRDGRVVIAEAVDPLRALRRYITGVAWHVHQNWRDLYRHRFEVFKPPPPRGHDPLPRHEAASMLRALDMPRWRRRSSPPSFTMAFLPQRNAWAGSTPPRGQGSCASGRTPPPGSGVSWRASAPRRAPRQFPIRTTRRRPWPRCTQGHCEFAIMFAVRCQCISCASSTDMLMCSPSWGPGHSPLPALLIAVHMSGPASRERPSALIPRFTHVQQIGTPLTTKTPTELMLSYRQLRKLQGRTNGDQGHGRLVKFDLTGCPEIDPGGLLLLMYHGLELKKRGWGTYLGGLGGTVKQVLLNLDHYLAPKDARASFDAPPGDFLLRGIDGKESMVAELMAWARTVQQATQASDERVALWQMQIAEVTTNGFQHGPRLGPMSGDLLINGKSYTERGEVQLAAIDFGAGIPRVIEIIGRPAKCVGDGDLIAYACEKGVTSRCVPQNQGAGLDSLIQTVRSSGGRLLMLSNNGLLYTAADEQQVRNLKPRKKYGDQVLNGTLTVINLRIRSDDRACQGH